MCLLVICISSLEKCLFRPYAQFFNWIVWFFLGTALETIKISMDFREFMLYYAKLLYTRLYLLYILL